MNVQDKIKKFQIDSDKVLRFLLTEMWTTNSHVQLITGRKSATSVTRFLSTLEEKGFLKRHYIRLHYKSRFPIWAITQHGIGASFDLERERPMKVLSPSKITNLKYGHHIDLQYIRILSEKAGWTDWRPDKELNHEKLDQTPDAIALTPEGTKVAVEVERSYKDRNRYAKIIVGHLKGRRDGLYQKIIYVCPTEKFAQRVRALMFGIKQLEFQGRKFDFSDRLKECFEFKSYEQFEQRLLNPETQVSQLSS